MAFKEWALVCDLLESGRQHLILRKGGIAEGREGFAFRHDAFLLFPTAFHAQAEGLRPGYRSGEGEPRAAVPDQPVPFSVYCRIVGHAILTDWEQVCALRSFHGWTDETLQQRFHDRGQDALHLAVVRTFRLREALSVPWQKGFAGCRSWISVPISTALEGEPVVDEAVHEQRRKEIDKMLPGNDLRSF